MTPPGWLVSVSDWPFKAAEAAVHLSNWLRTLQLPQLTRDCSQMCNKIQFGLVLCKDVPKALALQHMIIDIHTYLYFDFIVKPKTLDCSPETKIYCSFSQP